MADLEAGRACDLHRRQRHGIVQGLGLRARRHLRPHSGAQDPDTFTFRDLDYLQPVRHRSRGRPGVSANRASSSSAARASARPIRGACVFLAQQDRPADRRQDLRQLRARILAAGAATSKAAARRSNGPRPTWVKVWKAQELRDRAVRRCSSPLSPPCMPRATSSCAARRARTSAGSTYPTLYGLDHQHRIHRLLRDGACRASPRC